MKGFLKMILAVFVGLNLFLLVPLFFFIYLAGSSMSESAIEITPNSVFHLKLDGELKERSEEDFLNLTSGVIDSEQNFLGLDDVLSSIEAATNNENIRGIYLDCGTFSAAPASIQEIRDALECFKQVGKFVVSYGDFYTQSTYLLASVSDKVFMNPQGALELKGLALKNVFYKNLLDKIGVEIQVVKVGSFKSAVEPYLQTKMSDANRNQLTQLSFSIWNQMTSTIALSRDVDVEKINQFSNQGLMLFDAEETVKYGFVDSLVYEGDVKCCLEKLVGRDFESYSLEKMMNVSSNQVNFNSNKIALVYAVGAIDNVSSNNDKIDSKKLSKQLLKIAEDDAVKALVLRVNSPGGSAFGSEQIWKAMAEVKKHKPVIVSMGDYAASGGYYISCIADTIVAQPNTLTGSIGIFGLIPNAEQLLDKIGITTDVVKTNDLSDFGSIDRPMSSLEKTLMQKNVERGYELFVKRCADGRQMSIKDMKAIAEGRVWSGSDAQKIGLVDVLGGLDIAIDFAAQKANIEEYQIVEYPEKKDFLTLFVEELSSSGMSFFSKDCGVEMHHMNLLKNLKKMDRVQALLPYDVVID